jgi:hypothetical protein
MDLPFDLTDPPDRPPSEVSEPLFWRVAVCLLREHSPGLGGVGALVRCRTCAEVWPCRSRRLAERALIEACGRPAIADSGDSGAGAAAGSTPPEAIGTPVRSLDADSDELCGERRE